MKRKDFAAAEDALRRCRDSQKRMQECERDQDFADAWSDFLIGQQRVFSKLSAGATGAKSAIWIRKVKDARKSDELLAYVHQARHVDEHGLATTANARSSGISVSAANLSKPLFIRNMTVSDGKIQQLSGENLEISFQAADANLLPVTNRGVTYALPTTHLGRAWESSSALAVSSATMEYLEKLVSDGRGLLVD
ncbi:hypothetical protein AB7714_28395 [Tardiphaga sp. 1201_B9_N1_1]|uniref:hypothetical protein n=1 Tax=unclassified Tardiphaga TaxID=2631404 RepID=UPI003F282CCC